MFRKVRHLPGQVLTLCAGAFINRTGTLLMPFLTLYLTKDRGLGIDFATLAMGCLGLGGILGALVGGALADRIGRRPVILISLVGSTAVLCIFGGLERPWLILVAVTVFALLSDMFRPASAAMIADLVESERRPFAYAVMYMAINLGMAVGASVGGILATISFQWLFWVDAGTTAVFAVIAVIAIRETATVRGAKSASEPGANLIDAIKHITGHGAFLVFCGASLLLALVFMQLFSTWPVYLDQQGIGTDGYGVLITLNCLMVVGLQLPLTTFLGRYNRASVMVVSTVFTAVGFGAIAIASSYWQHALTVMLWTLGELMGVPFTSAIVTDMAPERFRARYLGVHQMSFWSAMMLGAPLGGLVLSRFDSNWLFGGAFAVGILSTILFASIHRHMQPSSVPTEGP